jgi:hypothetical protein
VRASVTVERLRPPFGAIERAAPGSITAAGLGDTAIHGQIELLHLATSDHAGNRNRFCEEAARRLGIPSVHRADTMTRSSAGAITCG